MITLVSVMFGPIVWTVHFLLVYGVQSIACAVSRPVLQPSALGLDPVQWTVVAATLAALALVLAPVLWRRPVAAAEGKGDELAVFIGRSTVLLIAISVFAIAATGSAALVLPTCAALR